ncbi:META domain-containing protein [Paracoccus sp. 11-3]|uniref:META domain-containing protein n=1 Tax=Paracoccus amoyensis TaxID=2760093 RepID=A0A926JAX8_9RHOB|nr:META domain-containing protein [Paracoccus amoyensis]MBC9246521.1 META domain-containing protein [Paracoccus amoyensis]
MLRYRNTIITLAALSLMSACAANGTGSAGKPPVGNYLVVSIDGNSAPSGTTMQIGEDHRVSGKGPCNMYGGQITETNGALTIIGVSQTRMACLEPARAAGDARFATALQSVTSYRSLSDKGGIALIDTEGKERLRLQPGQE